MLFICKCQTIYKVNDKTFKFKLYLLYIYFMFTLLNLNLFTLDIYHLVSLLYKEVMEESNNFCFNDGDKEFISITSYGAIWTNNQQKCRLLFSKTYKN